MRLLNTLTGELKVFEGGTNCPPYAILSHAWGEHEDTFEGVRDAYLREIGRKIRADFEDVPGPERTASTSSQDLSRPWTPLSPNSGLSEKLRGFCKYAADRGYKWVWVDTCCINKQSSAELSEAINSMFAWYAASAVCIAYLEDVPTGASEPTWTRSKWFTRGWTLQELIAPRDVVLVSRDWAPLGTKASLAGALEKVTRVDTAVLTFRRKVTEVCIAERMSWAADRETTRIEDRAYSLLGLFPGVHMPIIYGEGMHAFRRLQEELLRHSPDQTLFAWGGTRTPLQHGLFADDPSCFRDDFGSMELLGMQHIPPAVAQFCSTAGLSFGVVRNAAPRIDMATPSFTVTAHGVRAHLPIIRRRNGDSRYAIAMLAVRHTSSAVGLVLYRISPAQAREAHYVVGEHPQRRFRLALVAGSAMLPQEWVRRLGFDQGGMLVGWEDVYIKTAEEAALVRRPRPKPATEAARRVQAAISSVSPRRLSSVLVAHATNSPGSSIYSYIARG